MEEEEEEVMDGFAEFGWRGRIGYIVAMDWLHRSDPRDRAHAL